MLLLQVDDLNDGDRRLAALATEDAGLTLRVTAHDHHEEHDNPYDSFPGPSEPPFSPAPLPSAYHQYPSVHRHHEALGPSQFPTELPARQKDWGEDVLLVGDCDPAHQKVRSLPWFTCSRGLHYSLNCHVRLATHKPDPTNCPFPSS